MSIAANGDALLAAGKYEDAVLAYSAAIEESTDSPSYYLQRSIAQHKLKNYAAALQDSESAVSLAIKRGKKDVRTTAQFRRGLALHGLRRYKDSLTCLQDAEQDGCKEKALGIWLAKLKTACDTPETREQDQSTGIERTPGQSAQNADAARQTAAIIDTPMQPCESAIQECKDSWYQNPGSVVLTIYARGLTPENCKIEIQHDSVSIRAEFPSTGKVYQKTFAPLCEPIKPEATGYRILSSKIELVLAKSSNINWSSLEKKSGEAVAPAMVYPTSSHTGAKNWDKLANEGAVEPEPEGDAALNKLFQDLYKDADEDTRRAMIKSFTESNGTSLSTDWKSVGKGKVEAVPPEGMEARQYNT